MDKTDITFHNELKIKVQAQIFIGSDLISTCVAEPGKSCTMTSTFERFDIYCKNGMTGWILTYKLNSDAQTLTLSSQNGGYVMHEG